ncbi:MAG: hypothetical protein JST82_03085 [Bacteroidetes bacterium]|nr:hypothetical protein [Bacteroidota bacterium]
MSGYTSIQQMPYNPAMVNYAITGPEINVYGLSVLAGNNAYSVNKRLLFNQDGDAKEGVDYAKLNSKHIKRGWANVDILGPAVGFTYKKQYQIGIYTRFRSVANAGGLTNDQFTVLTNEKDPRYYNYATEFKKTGASAHAFGEIGFSVGKMLRDDDYFKVRVGVNVKYLIGFAAFNVYTKSLAYYRLQDSLEYGRGDLTTMFTYNTNPSSTGELSQRAGKGGLGLDIGIQFEYHPDGDPNKKTPYKYAVAASITDIGSVTYVGDKGSATYKVNAGLTMLDALSFQESDRQEIAFYSNRMKSIGLMTEEKAYEKFRIGLPTAFRLNIDYNLGSKFYTSVNTLMNLKGNGGNVYRPGYVGYLNITPRYDLGSVKFGLPITFVRWRSLNMGAVFNLGPFYLGSATLLSSLLIGNAITDFDVYTGLTIKLSNEEKPPKLREYGGYDKPWYQRLVPNFMRRKSSIYYCPRY